MGYNSSPKGIQKCSPTVALNCASKGFVLARRETVGECERLLNPDTCIVCFPHHIRPDIHCDDAILASAPPPVLPHQPIPAPWGIASFRIS